MKPHVHAELIKAWADGAQIQSKCPITGEWVDDKYPRFFEGDDYRIKPEEKKPVVRWLWSWISYDKWKTSTIFYSEKEAQDEIDTHGGGKAIKLEWSRTEFSE